MITELFPPRIEREIRGESFAGKPQFVLNSEMRDAFRITVRPDSCLAEGGKTGLLYARDLLDELRLKHGGIPCAEYSDSPDLKFRCYHINLKKGSGGDETCQLGKCPLCAEFVKDHSREKLFFKHISRFYQYAASYR